MTSIIRSDAFTRADGALSGSTLDNGLGGAGTALWLTKTGANWAVLSNKAVNTSSGADSIIVVNVPAVADWRIDAVFTAVDCGLIGRYIDANNNTLLYINSGTNLIRIYKTVGGVFSRIGSGETAYVSGHSYGLEWVGATYNVYDNGALAFTGTDSSIATGQWGMYGGGGGLTTIDAFEITGDAMTMVASDGFSGTNGDNVSGRTMDVFAGGTANHWALDAGSATIQTNKCLTGGTTIAHDTNQTPAADGDYSLKAVDGIATDVLYYVDATHALTADVSSGGIAKFWKGVPGGTTQIGSDGPMIAANDVIMIRKRGNGVSMLVNGLVVLGPFTLSGGDEVTYATGVGGWRTFGARTLDDYRGETPAVAGTVPTYSYHGTPYAKTQGASIGTVSPTKDAGDDATGFTKRSGSFPTGCSMNATTGAITGTPTAYGTFTAVVYASNATGDGPDTTVVFNVAQSAAPTLAYVTPRQAVVGAALTVTPTAFTGYGKTVTVNRTLPDGLSLNASTGVVSGTPTDAAFTAWQGTRDLIFTNTDANGVTATATVRLSVVYQFTIHGENADGSDDTVETVTWESLHPGGGPAGPFEIPGIPGRKFIVQEVFPRGPFSP